jgi:hypothetical protein
MNWMKNIMMTEARNPSSSSKLPVSATKRNGNRINALEMVRANVPAGRLTAFSLVCSTAMLQLDADSMNWMSAFHQAKPFRVDRELPRANGNRWWLGDFYE